MRNSIKARPIQGLAVDRALKALYESIREIQQLPFARRSWSYLENESFGASSTKTVEHNLGRVPVGWLVLDAYNVQLYRSGAWSETTVALTNSRASAGTANILFF